MNDGMLHAINGQTNLVTDPNGGKEVWAYIPSMLLPGPSGSPGVDGLQALSQVSGFQHHFYADQTPAALEVDFDRTSPSPSSLNPAGTGTPNWHSLLVAGLNKGGKGFYALDVTDGATAATEAAAAAKVLWEFTDADMGYSYGKPIIGKTRKHGWVVFVTSGYDNVSGPSPGQGFLYVLDAKTGTMLEKISTGASVGSATDPSGLARIQGYVVNYSDYTVEQIYGGDLKGNLWRFDVSQPATNVAAFPAPQKIAVLMDSLANPQAITMAPEIRIAKNNIDRWIFVGTGRFLAATDRNNSQQQTMYALRDGTKSAPYTSATLPATFTFPIAPRSAMVQRTNLTAAITPDLTKPMGWYYDLTGTSSLKFPLFRRVHNPVKV